MINLNDYGFTPTPITDNSTATVARITAVHKERYGLVCEHGQIFGQLKTGVYLKTNKENIPTVGDFVLIDYNTNGDSRIIKTLERKSYFSRLDPSSSGHAEQAIAANFDYVFIMASLNYDFNLNRIERYLTLSWQSGAVPIVVLTKSDLVEDYSEQICAVTDIAVGVDIFAISAKSRYGLDALSQYLKPRKTIVFLGSSGVGKSSLVNALTNEGIMAVSEIRDDDSKGKHTTTHRQLIMLQSGVMIIDTPGMRELGMWDVSEGLGQSFSDVERYFENCKFNDCSHTAEPGCAVKPAIKSGELPLKRWESYCNLKKEAKFSESKSDFLILKQERAKAISKYVSKLKKNGGVKGANQ